MEDEVKYIIDNEAIGNKIRQGRETLGLTRDQLAEFLGISSYYLGQLERGERQMSLPVLVKIAEKLHLSLDYLIFERDPDQSNNATDIEALLKKCSKKELELVRKLIKTILPYTN